MDSSALSRIRQLDDIDLAILVSFISEQHCMVSSMSMTSAQLSELLYSKCSRTFGLSTALTPCNPNTTAEKFSSALLVERNVPTDAVVINRMRIADVIIAPCLDTAPKSVQVQALELLRTGRILTREAAYTAPKHFLFIATCSHPDARLTRHLNDLFALSHCHQEGDQLRNLDLQGSNDVMISPHEVDEWRTLARSVGSAPEIAGYLHDVVVFLRMSRYVAGGVTAAATSSLRTTVRSLAVLNNVDFVTPALVMLAARKVYAHRLVLATHETERSLQWGSDPVAIQSMMADLSPLDVIEMVLSEIEAPL